MAEVAANQQWNGFRKAGLRVTFLYVLFYIYPYGFEYVSGFDLSTISFWPDITVWFGETFLGWEFNKDRLLNGFDSKYDYSRFLLITVLSIIGTGIWLWIDARFRFKYNDWLAALLKTVLRYHVGLTLILYGLSKVFMLQFGEMDLESLEDSIGSHTGMSFLWTFMSYSKFYTMAAGWVEVIGGVLLFFRKTTFLGAFILFVAMANVVLMDIGYDVSVKMFAIHLFLMTLVILGDNLRRIFNFFLNNTIGQTVDYPRLFPSGKSANVALAAKGILLLYFAVVYYNDFTDRLATRKTNRFAVLTGFHEVESMVINGDTLSSATDVEKGWKSISINGHSYIPETLMITTVDDKSKRFRFEADTLNKEMKVFPFRGDEKEFQKLRYASLPEKRFVFEGIYQGDSISVSTRYKTFEDYLLTKRGVRWVRDLK